MLKCKWREFRYLLMVCIFRPYKNTMGFLNYRYFSLKFDKHAREFGIKSELKFARSADAFVGQTFTLFRVASPSSSLEWFRRKHDKMILKYDNPQNVLGFVDKDNYLRTYFHPLDKRQYVIGEFNK